MMSERRRNGGESGGVKAQLSLLSSAPSLEATSGSRSISGQMVSGSRSISGQMMSERRRNGGESGGVKAQLSLLSSAPSLEARSGSRSISGQMVSERRRNGGESGGVKAQLSGERFDS